MSETKLAFPTIHLNGTAAVDLIEQYQKAHNALQDALSALIGTSPNGRDYYVQGDLHIHYATHDHLNRCERLRSIDAEIMAIWENVQEQEDERQRRKQEALRR